MRSRVFRTRHHSATAIASAMLLAWLMVPPSTSWAQTFSSTGSMNVARVRHQATRLVDGRVLISGGSGANDASIAAAELYDPATGTFAVTGSTLTARQNHTATLLADGRVLITGGIAHYSNCASSNTAETFDPATGLWTATPNLPWVVGTGHMAVSLQDGRVLVMGGGNRCGGVYNTAALFNPSTNTWAATGYMTMAREFHDAVRLPDGRVLVAGGVGSSPFSYLA
jgi:hypothetical protein